MAILKVEQIFIFQQACCYGNSCELLFVRTLGAKATAWGSPGSPRALRGQHMAAARPGRERGRGESSAKSRGAAASHIRAIPTYFISTKFLLIGSK